MSNLLMLIFKINGIRELFNWKKIRRFFKNCVIMFFKSNLGGLQLFTVLVYLLGRFAQLQDVFCITGNYKILNIKGR